MAKWRLDPFLRQSCDSPPVLGQVAPVMFAFSITVFPCVAIPQYIR